MTTHAPTIQITEVDETTVEIHAVGIQGPALENGVLRPELEAHAADELAARNAAIAVETQARIDAIAAEAQARMAEVAQEVSDRIAAIAAHAADTTDVHGIPDTSQLIKEGDARLTNPRTPTGGAGGVLSGSYPNPGFAVDMAEQGELESEIAARQAADALLIPLTQKGAAGGVAPLNNQGKLDAIYISALFRTTPFTVGSEAEMLALDAQEGDFAIRTDVDQNFVLGPPGDPTVLANWIPLRAPAGGVTSVEGRTGAVDLSDLFADRAHEDLTTAAHGGIVAASDARLSDQRVPTNGSVTDAKVASDAAIAESKLNLASDAAAATPSRRSLGAGALQAAAGNDARLSDQRVPTDGSVTNAKVAAGAAIAKSKLANLDIVNADVNAAAAIAESKLALASDAAAGTASRRTLGTGAAQAMAGNDSRVTGARRLLEEQILGADAATVTFPGAGGNLPTGFRHLELVIVGRGTDAALQSMFLRFNGDTGNNYDFQNLRSNAAAVTANELLANNRLLCAVMAPFGGQVSNVEVAILDYARDVFEKTARIIAGYKAGTASGSLDFRHRTGWWRNTAAITSITVGIDVGNFVAGSVFSLYGVP